MTHSRLTLSFLLLLTICNLQAETLQGKVIHITDGDTLTMLTQLNKKVKIRLEGIDAPEKAQPFGNKAKQSLANLTFQKQVSVQTMNTDKYGHTAGIVMSNNVNVNAKQVRLGMAWVYPKSINHKKLLKLETNAKQAKRGLWASDRPIEPWLWRKGKRTVSHKPSIIKGIVIGDKRSKVYYLSNCKSHYVVKHNKVLFKSEALAMANGYRKAGTCH